MKKIFQLVSVFFFVICLIISPLSTAFAQSGDHSLSFVQPAAIIIPAPITPSGSTTDTTPTYTWTKITGATQYQMVVYKSGKQVAIKIVSPTYCGTTQCTYTPTTALSYGSYTWKIHAYIAGWKSYSALKTFSIIPPLPVPTSPKGITTDTTPTFIWTKVPGASQYRYSLYQMSGTSASLKYTKTVASSICGIKTCASTPPIIINYASYKWKVQALVSGTWRTYSALTAFSTVTPASLTPISKTPTGTITKDIATFTWTKVAPASKYLLYVYKGTTAVVAASVPITACGVTYCTATPAKVLVNGTYSWKVRAMVNNVLQPFSATKAFVVKAVIIPTQLSPLGYVFPIRPIFTWSKLLNTTYYNYIVYNKNGVIIHNYTINATTCGANYCIHKPAVNLTASANYTWKVRAKVSGYWRAFSSTQSFRSQTIGWTPVWGTWPIDANGYYITAGVNNAEASTKYNGSYSTVTYEARIRRTGTWKYDPNFLIIRGTPNPLGANKMWGSSLRFEYANTGQYSIYLNGVPKVSWASSSAIRPNDWNILKVTASGPNMVFYINGTRVWYGSIPDAPASGLVGLGMMTANSTDATNRLYVDWMRVSNVVTASAGDPTDYPLAEAIQGDGTASAAP